MRTTISRILAVASSTWTAAALIGLIALYLSAVSIAQALSPVQIERLLGVPAHAAYGHRLIVTLWALLCVNMSLATLTRVRFDLPRAGTWCSHAGVLMLAAGACWYGLEHRSGVCVANRWNDSWGQTSEFYLDGSSALYVGIDDRWRQVKLPPLMEHVRSQRLDRELDSFDGVHIAATDYIPSAQVRMEQGQALAVADEGGNPRAFSVLNLEIAAGDWRKRMQVVLDFMPDRAISRRLELPDGRSLELILAAAVAPLGATIRVLDAQGVVREGTASPKDYRCRIEVSREQRTSRETVSLNHPASVGQYRLTHNIWDSFDDPRQIVFNVNSRPGMWLVWAGMALIAAGLPWAFYVKPLLLRRRGNG